MAEENKNSIDLKNLTPSDLIGLLKSALGKDSSLKGSKAVMFIALGFITSFILIYLIFGRLDNQALYDEQYTRYSQASTELAALTKKFDKTIKDNKVYFGQLFNSPKTDNELSARVTNLITNYNLKLLNIDLQKALPETKEQGVGLEISGTYTNLLKFCNELNKNVAASQIINLQVEKKKNTNNLVMKVVIKFSAPPNPETIPKLNAPTVGIDLQKFQATLLGKAINNALNFLVTEAAANDKSALSAFQQAYVGARKQGLYEFDFVLNSGERRSYLTGLSKTSVATLPEKNNLSNLPPLQSKLSGVEAFNALDIQPVRAVEIIYEDDYSKVNFRKAGFVEAQPIENESRTSEMGSENNEATRDPFAPPTESRAAKKRGSGSTTDSEDEQFYLAGIMMSDEMNLCIIQTPEGDFKIYGEGDKVSNKVTLTQINFDSIHINKLNERKVIVFGEQVN
tara:strand:+ start:1714 stop:3075 length:1362 start_codon:yes stop_codon:yes gene_type:complete